MFPQHGADWSTVNRDEFTHFREQRLLLFVKVDPEIRLEECGQGFQLR